MEETIGKKIQSFFINTLNGMAHGLFATLIVGTIFGAIGQLFHLGAGNPFCDFMFKVIGDGKQISISYILQVLTGIGVGVGIGLALKLDPLKVICLAVVGELAAIFSLSTAFVSAYDPAMHTAFKIQIGDPLTIYVAVICTALLMKLVLTKKTPVDILIVPLFTVIVGATISMLVRYPLIYVTYGVQWIVSNATNVVPFLMGIIIAVLMGMALTAPISSAAIAAMIFVASETPNEGLMIASGAAIVGCCTQMIGFAIQSRKDNPIGTVISIGIGTSMLQFKNIIKKPVIWLPTIIASAILGPISTCLIKVVCMGSSAGMGTAGLVGIIGTITSMGVDSWQTWVGIIVLELVGPAVLVFFIDLLFRKLGWIKEGDMKI